MAEPHGAEDIALILNFEFFSLSLFGRNSARCSATHTGPTPGPPPPCGIANVL